MLRRTHLVPCFRERQGVKQRKRFAPVETDQMFDEGQTDNGSMKRRQLSRSRSIVGVFDGSKVSSKRDHGFEASMKDDGVVGMAQRFKPVHQRFSTRMVALKQRHGVLNQTHADGYG